MHRLIESEADLAEAVAGLSLDCEVMRRVLPVAGPPPMRRAAGGFDGLLRIIVDQQVSVAAGAAIWAKVCGQFPVRSPAIFLAAPEEQLKASGLSGPKIRTIRAIAAAMAEGALDLDSLGAMNADAAKATMVTIKGIGPWTADIYMMFCLGHADAFAPGDLALQEAIRLAFRLDERPSAREAELIAERWRPWRAVAARVLWGYYKAEKQRAGIGV